MLTFLKKIFFYCGQSLLAAHEFVRLATPKAVSKKWWR